MNRIINRKRSANSNSNTKKLTGKRTESDKNYSKSSEKDKSGFKKFSENKTKSGVPKRRISSRISDTEIPESRKKPSDRKAMNFLADNKAKPNRKSPETNAFEKYIDKSKSVDKSTFNDVKTEYQRDEKSTGRKSFRDKTIEEKVVYSKYRDDKLSETKTSRSKFSDDKHSEKRPAIKGSISKKTVIKNKNDSVDDQNKSIRINKFLADSGVCSRRKADDLILSGVVKVNSIVVKELGTKVTHTDFITVNGDPIREFKQDIYILLNKPKNIITTTSDELGRKTVLDIVKKHTRIFPVGRLDRNTTGALLLTNDGELAYRLTHPSYEIERIYIVKLDKNLKLEHAKQISHGVELDDGNTGPAEILVNPDDNSKVTLKLHEGKNHEVKRIFEHLGYDVKQLSRKYFANLSVSGLALGDYRHLNKTELKELKTLVGLV
jgi:23S rRNA pseudouridine2605 synthase